MTVGEWENLGNDNRAKDDSLLKIFNDKYYCETSLYAVIPAS